ncbi:MAG: glycogen debranching protein GlgX [Gammaproteobacteria bacterium]|nr:glycogen debranching protein GlgX [Gammaproteobacteria bacterium]NNK34280.1 glycogen debranching protein GlgX [Xanthomonadales bacterium]
MIENGHPEALGPLCTEGGVNFAIWSGSAEAVELCLFDDSGRQTETHLLPGRSGDVWHGFLPGIGRGQRYGYRVHGSWDPAGGLRHNPAKLLLDPYARRLAGQFRRDEAWCDFDTGSTQWRKDERDSAAFLPKCVVDAAGTAPEFQRPGIPWSEAVIYEANVRGFTMRHPGLTEAERGKFTGLRNGQILAHLKALGITSLELMPVHCFIEERHLADAGLSNLWGYNSIHFFAGDPRFAVADGPSEFRDMVNAIHEAGIEVILDVAYNHTGEGGDRGPMLCFRGIDNLAYYRTEPNDPASYINDTGCGNTINSGHPAVQELILASLRYWHREMGVDGFRFDLAPVLGRRKKGFKKSHKLLERISADPELWGAKLIAEPWDPGPGGYQLGRFPAEYAEWNDRYRDSIRRFWRGDHDKAGDFARRIHGSADLFEPSGRNPPSSINFVTSHDGFTLHDLVSYRKKHNEANGENNRDGHGRNYSDNHGVEGPSEDPDIRAIRRRQRLNLLATLMFSQGTPMLLAGDELGNSQSGNNNAYAQDNEVGWVDWSGLVDDPSFFEDVCRLVHLRRDLPLLRQARYIHGRMPVERGWCDINWLHRDGRPMDANDWYASQQLTLLFSVHEDQKDSSPVVEAVALFFNASREQADFHLPPGLPTEWRLRFASSEPDPTCAADQRWAIPGRSLTLLTGEL